VTGRAAWVLSPTDGKAHLLTIEGPGGVVLATQCGQSLPLGVVQHDRLPSCHLCRECFTVYLLPDPVFARQAPAGHRSSPAPAPGGQPDPPVVPAPASAAAVPRWARCPVDQQLPLLGPAGVREVVALGCAQSLCGRLLFAQGLTLSGRCGVPCVSCLAAGTT
jgi:hypothetical protein